VESFSNFSVFSSCCWILSYSNFRQKSWFITAMLLAVILNKCFGYSAVSYNHLLWSPHIYILKTHHAIKVLLTIISDNNVVFLQFVHVTESHVKTMVIVQTMVLNVSSANVLMDLKDLIALRKVFTSNHLCCITQ
jgi:hypothetical protein